MQDFSDLKFTTHENKKGDIVLMDTSKLGTTVKEGKNQKTLLSHAEEQNIIDTFNRHETVEDFTVVLSYDQIKEKNYSFSARQYFEVKIEYTDITPEEFTAKMNGYKQNLDYPADIGNLELEIPFEKITQQKIASVLSALDSKIELNNRINAELEAMAKTLYDYWFVQFDFPDEHGKPYKSSGGKMIWNDKLKREIPDGWEIGTLLDIANYTNGLPCQNLDRQEMNL